MPCSCSPWLSPPNLLTYTRTLLVLPLLYSVSQEKPGFSLALFALIIASDVFDGILARRLRTPNPHGTLIDHGADAFVVVCLCTMFSFIGLCSLFLPITILAAFAQYAFGANKTNDYLPRASLLGKLNGINYYLFCGACLLFELLKNDFSPNRLDIVIVLLNGYAWALVLSSIVSIGLRVIADRT